MKTIVNSIAVLIVLPGACWYWMASRLVGPEKAFSGWTQAFGLLPGLTGVYLRRAFYRLVLPKCGSGSVVSFGTVFSHPTAEIGDNAYIGVYCSLGDVTIEEDVLIGSHVSVMNGCRQHGIERLDVPVREQPGEWPRITIGCDTWIGDRAIIMADVGQHCVVGAGAVVTKSVKDYEVVVGSPARVVGTRRQQPDLNPAVALAAG